MSGSTSSSRTVRAWGAKVAQAVGVGGGATKWEQSKQKGEMGYYFAHHTSNKELKPEDYRMNGPRLLSKTTSVSDNFAGSLPCSLALGSLAPFAKPRQNR